MCIMMCIIMRAIGYYGATFFQSCFVSFADEQSAIHFVLEDWLITTLLVVHCKICRWADVHIVHIVQCIFLSTARDCTSLCVHVHMSSITQISSRYSCKSTTLVASAKVLSSTSLVKFTICLCSSYILCRSTLFVYFCTCFALVCGWCQCLCYKSLQCVIV